MKQIITAFAFFCLISCSTDQDKFINSISSLPSFDIIKLDSNTLVHASDISAGNPIVLVYFRPDCPHCQAETENLLKNIKSLNNIQIYFLAGASLEDVRAYSKQFKLDSYKNITIGKDYNHSFAKIFKPEGVPYTAIYDSNKQLVKIYSGEVTSTDLLSAIHG